MRTLLTPAEATRKYGLTPETWRRWERIGWVEAIKTPTGRRLFTEAAIELALRERARRDRQAVRMGK